MGRAHSEEETEQFLYFYLLILSNSTCVILAVPASNKCIRSKKQIKIFQMWLCMQNSSSNYQELLCVVFFSSREALVWHVNLSQSLQFIWQLKEKGCDQCRNKILWMCLPICVRPKLLLGLNYVKQVRGDALMCPWLGKLKTFDFVYQIMSC